MALSTDAEPPWLSLGPFLEIPDIVSGLSDIIHLPLDPSSVLRSLSQATSLMAQSLTLSPNPFSIDYTYEGVHWINTFRGNDDRTRNIVSTLHNTESQCSRKLLFSSKIIFIRELRIAPPNFSLENASNFANREYRLAILSPNPDPLESIVSSIKAQIHMPSLRRLELAKPSPRS